MSSGKEEKEEETKEKETEGKSQSCGATGGDMAETDDADEESLTAEIQRLMESIGLCKTENQQEEKKESEQLLDEVTFDGIAKYIQSDKCENIVVMAGAGISTAAGIPDFRSPGTGLYDNLQQYNLPYPEAIFDIDFFREKPEPFFKLAKELYPGNFKATMTHYFIRLLNEKGLLLRHYTQNIDTLERVAGIPGDKLVEAHGTFYSAHCLRCRKSYTQDWIKCEVFADKIPICEETSCGGVVKPDIVFFGESLLERFSRLLSKDMPKCDLLIIMGTSLAVQPFASLVNHVRSTTPRLLINREKCGNRQAGNLFLYGGGSGLNFDDPKNYRDVAWLGSCDDGCIALADLLGWKAELIKLVAEEHKKIDEKAKEGDGHLNKKDKSEKAEEEEIETKEVDKSKENRTEDNSEFKEAQERNTNESAKATDLESRKDLDKKQGDGNGES